MRFTKEQEKIINYNGDLLVVKAFAGTGKTSTLVNFSKKHKEKQILYLAYNRAIRDEATAKFPKNVHCKTAHQLAYAYYGKQYHHKIKNNISIRDIGHALNIDDWTFASRVLKTLNAFLSSSDRLILAGHVVLAETEDDSFLAQQNDQMVLELEEVANATTQLWIKMQDINDSMPISHDAYLKMFQLSEPDLSIMYSYILVDEAQDITPVVNALVLNQACKLIYVGDPHQQIYRWRGAENAMEYNALKKADKLNLTHSFRFGKEIAMVANTILEYKEETLHIVGKGAKDQIGITMDLLENQKPVAVLSRTVNNVIQTALVAAKENKHIYWVGGINSYGIDSIEDVYHLSNDNLSNIKNKKLIEQFPSYDDYVSFSKENSVLDMQRYVTLLKKHKNIYNSLTKIRQLTVTEESQADIILSTIHRSKGLEWPYVVISDDFLELAILQNSEERLNDELNLLYVAVTRATNTLIINTIIRHVMSIVIRHRLGDV